MRSFFQLHLSSIIAIKLLEGGSQCLTDPPKVVFKIPIFLRPKHGANLCQFPCKNILKITGLHVFNQFGSPKIQWFPLLTCQDQKLVQRESSQHDPMFNDLFCQRLPRTEGDGHGHYILAVFPTHNIA